MSKDKESIQVTIRVRPLSQKQKLEDNRICVDVEDHTHSIQTFYANENKKFTFDSIANNNTQHDMFLKVGKKSTIYCLEGYNCTIFAYGQTGSGKTFTMMGVDPAHESYDELRGLIPRTLEYLFESIDMEIKQTSSEYIIRCSFLEIYNEQIIDLLNPKNNSNLQIREDIKKGVYVEGITEETIFKGDEALQILKKGSKGRHVGSTCYNETSSRSHSVFTMQIESKHTKNGVVNTKIRYFHFIDLAGSERTKQINGQRLKQGCSINKSLHVLGKVINSLAESSEGKSRHINYRDSKLTFLLKDSLGGNSKTHLIANISPCAMSYSETNMTLAFARRVKLIKVNKASINEDMSGNLEGLKNEIKRLKQEIIVLRNGNTGVTVSLDNSDSFTEPSEVNGSIHSVQSNSKMMEILNRYVSQELDKQTKFQGEINKLNKKLDCLQSAIRKYAENQVHLKMIISVYEDKVKRTKKVEALLSAKIDELNSQSDESIKIIEYFRQEREELMKETDNYKKILNENSNALLKLIKSCKAYQSEVSKEDNKEELLQLIRNNTQFLTLINSELKEIKQAQDTRVSTPENNKSVQQMIEERVALMDLEYNKKENELLERVEQLQLEINEFKSSNEETEMLLKDSVNREINLEEEIKAKQAKIIELEDRVKILETEKQEEKMKSKASQKEFEEIRKENATMREQIEAKDVKIQELKKVQSEVHQTKRKNVEYLEKISLLESKIVDSIKEYEEKLFELEQNLKSSQSKHSETIKQLLFKQTEFSKDIMTLKQQLQERQYTEEELTYQHKKQIEQTTNTISKLQTQIIRHEKQLASLNDSKLKLEEKLKQTNQKCFSLTEQLENTQEDLQNQSLQMIHLRHQLEAKSSKITHLQSSLKTKLTEEESFINKSKLKEEELMEIIHQMQSSSDSSSQEFNKIRIELIHLKQVKTELQAKNNKLNQEIKKFQLEVESKNHKIQEISLELQEKTKKIFAEKQEITRKKEEVRNLAYLLEQSKSELTKLQNSIIVKDEEFEEIHAKNISLLEEINHNKKELNQTKLHFKEVETKLFCLQKSSQIEKESLISDYEKKINKLNETNNAKTNEAKKLEKIINQQKLMIQSITLESNSLKELNSKNEEIFKETLEKELMTKISQMNTLKQKISLMEDQFQALKKENEQKIEALEQDLKESKSKEMKTSSELSQTKDKLSISIKSIEEKFSIIKNLEQNIEELKENHERELEDLEVEHNEQIDSKNEEIEKKNELIEEKIRQIEEKMRQIEAKKAIIEEKSGEIEEKSGEIDGKSAEIEMIKVQIGLKNQQISEMDTELKNLSEQMIKSREMIAAQEIEMISKDQEMSESVAKINELRQQLEKKKEEIVELSSVIEESSKKIECLRQELSLKEQLIEKKEQLIEKTLSENNQKQNSTFTQLNAFIQQKDSFILSLKNQIQSLSAQREMFSDQNQKLTQNLEQSQAKIQTLQAQHSTFISNIQNLNNKLTQLSTSYSKLQAELDSTISLNEKKETLISNLNKNLYELQKAHSQQNSLIPQLSKQISTRKSIIDSKQEEITLLHVSIKELHHQLEQLKKQKLILENKYEEICTHNDVLETSIEELNHKLNQINSIHQELQGYNQQIKEENMLFVDQMKSLKEHHENQLRQQKNINHQNFSDLQQKFKETTQRKLQLESIFTEQKQKIQNLEQQLREKQSLVHNLSRKVEDQIESNRSLQQINKGLGKKCEEHIFTLEEQRTEYRKLQTKYFGEKSINENLKQLIENSEQQKKHLTMELKEKTQIYNKLLQKLSKNESLHGQKQKKSEHYAKTVELLEKSRFEQLELRKSNEELKKQIAHKNESLHKKEQELKEISKKHETMQSRVKHFEEDYLELQKKYEQLMENQKIYEKLEQENQTLKQQLQETRPKISRMTLKIEELEQRMRSANEEYIQLQEENHNLKKKILYPGTVDEKISMYINTLKSEINDLKKQKQILEDTLKKETAQRMKLKTQMIRSSSTLYESEQFDKENEMLQRELDKRQTELNYLKGFLAEIVQILNYNDYELGVNPNKIKVQSIRNGIINLIKEMLKENTQLKERIHQIQSKFANHKEKQNKSLSSFTSISYNGIGSQGSAKKETSFNTSTQKIQRREKSFSMKEEDSINMARYKGTHNSVHGTQSSQEKREKKGIIMDGIRNMIDNDEISMNNTRQKMKVKEIVTNSGKFYKNLQ